MKLKSWLLAAMFSFALTPFAMAESAEHLYHQGISYYKKGDAATAKLFNKIHKTDKSPFAELYTTNSDIQKNYAQAFQFYKKACDKGHQVSCLNLGYMYANNEGVQQNYTEAAKLFEKTCNNMVAQGCFNLGILYRTGTGVQQNLTYAKKYFERACDMKEEEACIAYSLMN